MTAKFRWAGLLLAAIAAPLAVAKGDAAAGAAKAAVCTACHGPNGNSVSPIWPSLAGQDAVYIERQLKDFHDKLRIDSTNLMPPMALALSDQDIQNLAAYFSQQTPTGLEADPSYWQAGEALYRGGDRARAIPACMACHGPTGAGNPAAGYPALRGQQSVYVIKQLTDYAGHLRYTKTAKGDTSGGDDAKIMETVASRLTQVDMRNLASYIQGIR